MIVPISDAAGLLTERRRLNAALREFVAWHESSLDAPADEVWSVYWRVLRSVHEEVAASDLGWRVHPGWRIPLATAFSRTALARLTLDPFPYPEDGDEEAWLWQAALGCSHRATRSWEASTWFTSPAVEHGYLSVKHRLADLWRRQGRIDMQALSLYVEVFTAVDAPDVMDGGPGGRHHPAQLLEAGTRLDSTQSLDEVIVRQCYSLCLRLAMNKFPAQWVIPSLNHARTLLADFNSRISANAASKMTHSHMRST